MALKKSTTARREFGKRRDGRPGNTIHAPRNYNGIKHLYVRTQEHLMASGPLGGRILRAFAKPLTLPYSREIV